MKRPAPPPDLRYRASEAARILHELALPPADRARVCLICGAHPEDLGWMSVVRVFVMADLWGIKI